MKKRLISFSDPQYEWLQTEAGRLGLPVSELVRRAVDACRGVTTDEKDVPRMPADETDHRVLEG